MVTKKAYARQNSQRNVSITVIGAGGIGSNMIPFIPTATDDNGDISLSLSVFDPDIIHPKNIKYNQSFSVEDMFKSKAQVVSSEISNALWYNREFMVEKDLLKQGDPDIPSNDAVSDVYILCVDDSEFRRRFYSAIREIDAFWIDLRAEGTAAQVVVRHRDWDKDIDALCSATLPAKPTKTGCIVDGVIDFGHMAAAVLGLQALARWFRGEDQDSMKVISC